MADRLSISLTELHCHEQSETGGCEPYLFTSFFAIGDGGVEVASPAHHDVRSAFANDVEAGQKLPVPQEIGTAQFTPEGSMREVGLVALVIDEDLSRDVAVEKGHQAFHAAVEEELRAYAASRNGQGAMSDEQKHALRDKVLSRVRAAVHGTYDYADIHRDQDDHLGVGVWSQSDGMVPLNSGPVEITVEGDGDRFSLSGQLSVG